MSMITMTRQNQYNLARGLLLRVVLELSDCLKSVFRMLALLQNECSTTNVIEFWIACSLPDSVIVYNVADALIFAKLAEA